DLLLAIYLSGPRAQTQSAMAKDLGLSQAEISYATKRLRLAQLVMQSSADVILPHLIEFSVHCARYNYPAVIGKEVRGIPTATLVEPLKDQVISSEGQVAWPSGQGTIRAQSLEPIHPSAPHAALANPRMYRLLSLLDGIRVGKNRLRQIATDLLVAELRAPRTEA